MVMARRKKKTVEPIPIHIVYCTDCAPPVILSAGPGKAVSHKIKGVTHEKVKTISLDPKHLRTDEEPPALYLQRLTKIYKDQLV